MSKQIDQIEAKIQSAVAVQNYRRTARPKDRLVALGVATDNHDGWCSSSCSSSSAHSEIEIQIEKEEDQSHKGISGHQSHKGSLTLELLKESLVTKSKAELQSWLLAYGTLSLTHSLSFTHSLASSLTHSSLNHSLTIDD